MRAHPLGGEPDEVLRRVLFTASLDHTIWFHRPMRADRWHLHDFSCQTYVGGRGLSIGHIFDEAGSHVATIAQEVLLRDIRDRANAGQWLTGPVSASARTAPVASIHHGTAAPGARRRGVRRRCGGLGSLGPLPAARAAPRSKPAPTTTTSRRSPAPTTARTCTPRSSTAILAVVSLVDAVAHTTQALLCMLLVAGPGRGVGAARAATSCSEARSSRAAPSSSAGPQEVLSQEELAPRRWAERLAPDDLPDFAGFELGRVYQAGSGLMAGDFYDVFRVAPTPHRGGDRRRHRPRHRAVITAFQAKYLLRVFLRQYRDPAQALEELNAQMSAHGSPRGVHLAVRRRVRHRGRHAALRVGRPPGGVAVARTRRATRCGPPARC